MLRSIFLTLSNLLWLSHVVFSFSYHLFFSRLCVPDQMLFIFVFFLVLFHGYMEAKLTYNLNFKQNRFILETFQIRLT